MLRLSLNKPVIPIPNLLLLMYKILLLRLLLPVKPLRSIESNLHLLVKIKIKIKGRVRIKRIKLIINNLINPRLVLLMIKKSENLVILVLSVLRIIIRNIVQDTLMLLSSSKGPRHHLHLPFFHNLFLLNSRPSWLFMTKLLPLPHIMYLCVLVTPRRSNLQLLLDPKIILLLRRNLMIHHLHWFNLLLRLHLPMALFI
jgi:hypothetical protein